MPYFDYDGDIRVDADEFVDACSAEDIRELIISLVKGKHIPQSALSLNYNDCYPTERDFEEALDRLHGKCYQLTKEEEETILKISKRL